MAFFNITNSARSRFADGRVSRATAGMNWTPMTPMPTVSSANKKSVSASDAGAIERFTGHELPYGAFDGHVSARGLGGEGNAPQTASGPVMPMGSEHSMRTPMPLPMTPMTRGQAVGQANNFAMETARGVRKNAVAAARMHGLPMSEPTGTTTTLPNGKVVNQYRDTDVNKAIRAASSGAYNNARASAMLPYQPVDPEAQLAQAESAREDMVAQSNAQLNNAKASEITARIPYLGPQQQAELDALVGRNSMIPATREQLEIENQRKRQESAYVGPTAEAGIERDRATADRQRAEADQARQPQDQSKDADAYYSGLMEQSYREFSDADKAGDANGRNAARQRYVGARDSLNKYREQRLGIGQPSTQPSTRPTTAPSPELMGGQQQGQGQQSQPIRSGTWNGQRVHMFGDGSVRDDQGRVIPQLQQ